MPKLYGIEHILYLVVWILIGAVSLYFIKKKVKDEKTINLIVKGVGVLLLIAIIWNRAAIAMVGKNPLKLLPESFCGTSSLVFSLAIIFDKKDNIVLHGVAYMGVSGRIITLLYPDFIGQAASIFHSRTISGLIHHTLMIYLFMLITLTKYFRPTYKKWYAVVLVGTSFITYGLLLIKVLGFSDAMQIENPILGETKLCWYALGGIFLLVYALFITLWELLTKLSKKSREVHQDTLVK